jgi:tyrosine-protein kinase Etk/Wzc
VDRAIPPDYKSKPKRALIVILTGLLAGFLAVIFAFATESLEKARRDPKSALRLDSLRQHLRWR